MLGDNGMGWIQLPDGRLLCRRCSEAADCPATGHQMSSWSWYASEGSRAGHVEPVVVLRQFGQAEEPARGHSPAGANGLGQRTGMRR